MSLEGTMTRARNSISLASWPFAMATVFSLAIGLLATAATPAVAALPRRLTAHTGQECSVAAPAVNGTASLVAFESTCDFTGTNADGNREIFQVDRNGSISQLTETAACTNANPSSSFSGGVVAFDSSCNFGGNADGNVEIFTVAATGVTQITSSANCYNLLPAINSNGTLVYFDSDCDLTGDNMDGSVEIFRAAGPSQIEQITDDRSASGCASINAATDASGDKVVFESDCDLDGGNPAQVNEIFAAHPSDGIVRLTNSQGDACVNATPALASDGESIAFASDCDLVGANPDAGTEIYTLTGETTTQLTEDAGAHGCESVTPSIGTREGEDRVVFAGYCDPIGENADGSFEIFKVAGGITEQVTSGESCWSVTPRLPASAEVVVYVSTCDQDGSGDAGSPDLYLEGLCVCGAPVSAAQPTATDALYALQTGVGAQECPLCECDVNDDGRVAATDALRILSKATGQNIVLTCP
jgi:Tol biopolymer transport system component